MSEMNSIAGNIRHRFREGRCWFQTPETFLVVAHRGSFKDKLLLLAGQSLPSLNKKSKNHGHDPKKVAELLKPKERGKTVRRRQAQQTG
jgi:hypothetical protein